MESPLIPIALYSFVLLCSISLVLNPLAKRLEQEQSLLMQRYLNNSLNSLVYPDSSWTYGRSPRLKILTWIRLFRNSTKTLIFVRDLTFMVLLADVLALVASSICNSCLAITLS